MMRTITDRVLRPAFPVAAPMLLVVAAVLLFSMGSESVQRDGVFMLVNMLAVIGLWVFVGNSGIISFGHVAFLGIGAYTSAVLTTQPQLKHLLIKGMPSFLADAHVSTFMGLLIAAAVAAAFALVIAVPLMRLTGLAAGIGTLAILIIVYTVLGQWRSVTNGLQTFSGIPSDATLWSTLPYVLVALLMAYLFRQSRLGLRLRASREDEIATRSIGVGVVGERTAAFVLSAAIVGAAGAVYAHYLGAITPTVFYFQATFLMLTMLVVGGMKSLGGAVVGSLVVTALTQGLGKVEGSVDSLQGLTDVALALVLIGILILRPKGIMGEREFRLPARLRPSPPAAGVERVDAEPAAASGAPQ
jgi:branched-chain amino acid transport system permease protein